MGSVWRAVHTKLGRRFAVKFLKSYGGDRSALEQRFLCEARLAAAVQHRYVVDIVDFGFTAEGTPYIVMEHLHGESLTQRLRRAPALSVRALCRVVAQALLGLEAVHRAGVVHRDLKPDNLVLVPEADGLVPKLVDFGISRAEESAAPGLRSSRLTLPGMAVGTPWYMAPEQARGEPIDRRADLYSVGVMVYEALTGRVPYEGDDYAFVMRAVTMGGAPTIEALRPEVGPTISALVERAMSRDRAARFASAGEMAAALEAAAPSVPEPLVCPLPTAAAPTNVALEVSSDGADDGAAPPGSPPAGLPPFAPAPGDSQPLAPVVRVGFGPRAFAPAGLTAATTRAAPTVRVGSAPAPLWRALLGLGVAAATALVGIYATPLRRAAAPPAAELAGVVALGAAVAAPAPVVEQAAATALGSTAMLTSSAGAPPTAGAPPRPPGPEACPRPAQVDLQAVPVAAPARRARPAARPPEIFRSPGF